MTDGGWSPAIAEAYERDGFVVLQGVVPETYLRGVQEVLERVTDTAVARWRDRADLVTTPAADEPLATRLHSAWLAAGRPADLGREGDTRLDPADLAALTADGWLLDLASRALGATSVRPLAESYFRAKMPGDRSTDIPWHQDAPCVAPVSGTEFVTAWIPLQPVTSTTSCLEVVPFGERRRLPTTWSPEIDYVAMDPVAHPQPSACRAVPMERGDVLVLGPHVPHRPLPQVDAPIRWSVDLRFAPVG